MGNVLPANKAMRAMTASYDKIYGNHWNPDMSLFINLQIFACTMIHILSPDSCKYIALVSAVLPTSYAEGVLFAVENKVPVTKSG